jgi:hypothetical protein
MFRVYWNNIDSIWFATQTNQENNTNDESFWFILNNNHTFNDCLLDKSHEYIFKSQNDSATLVSVRNLETYTYLVPIDLYMVSESIGVPLDDKKLNNSFYNG